MLSRRLSLSLLLSLSCLLRCLLLCCFLGFLFLAPPMHRANSRANTSTSPCISGDGAYYRAPGCPLCSTPHRTAFRCVFSCLLCSLLLRSLLLFCSWSCRGCRLWIHARILLRGSIAIVFISELLV
jgi:hypothetical protein